MNLPPVDSTVNFEFEPLIRRWMLITGKDREYVINLIDSLCMSPKGTGLDIVTTKKTLFSGRENYATGKFREPVYIKKSVITGESINRVEGELDLFSPNKKSEIECDGDNEVSSSGRSGKAKGFVEAALKAYGENFKGKPENLLQLLNFAQGEGSPVDGYSITVEGKGNNKKVHFGVGNGSVTYRAVSKAFSELMK